MAKAYQEGRGWCLRLRYAGQEQFFSGKPTKAAVHKAAREWMEQVDKLGAPHGDGPARTMMAQALQDYALERLPFLKGAAQDARRINTYLRLAGLQCVRVRPLGKEEQLPMTKDADATKTVYFRVELEPHASGERQIPRGLKAHRQALLTKTADTDDHRRALATKWMSKLTHQDLTSLVNAMRRDGMAPASIQLEMALLSVLFNHARKVWRWQIQNHASGLKLPKVNNARERVMSQQEEQLLDEALSECRNKVAAPTLTLLRETAMRASEPIAHAQWRHVDWERRILTLPDAKDGGREVPLSVKAMEALEQLKASYGEAGPQPTDPVVSISYEALKAAWRRACERAGIEDLHVHDLRHTGASRLALKTGNVFLVKALTGHKTMKMLERYVNVKASDVVAAMDRTDNPPAAPATLAPTAAIEGAAAPADVVTVAQLQSMLEAQEAKRQATIGALVAELSKRVQPAELGQVLLQAMNAGAHPEGPAANETSAARTA